MEEEKSSQYAPVITHPMAQSSSNKPYFISQSSLYDRSNSQIQQQSRLNGPIGIHYSDPRVESGEIILIKKMKNRESTRMQCPNCAYEGMTKVKLYRGTAVWASCLGFSLIGCLPLACCGLCLECCQDSEHYCHKCGKLIGTKRVLCC